MQRPRGMIRRSLTVSFLPGGNRSPVQRQQTYTEGSGKIQAMRGYPHQSLTLRAHGCDTGSESPSGTPPLRSPLGRMATNLALNADSPSGIHASPFVAWNMIEGGVGQISDPEPSGRLHSPAELDNRRMKLQRAVDNALMSPILRVSRVADSAREWDRHHALSDLLHECQRWRPEDVEAQAQRGLFKKIVSMLEVPALQIGACSILLKCTCLAPSIVSNYASGAVLGLSSMLMSSSSRGPKSPRASVPQLNKCLAAYKLMERMCRHAEGRQAVAGCSRLLSVLKCALDAHEASQLPAHAAHVVLQLLADLNTELIVCRTDIPDTMCRQFAALAGGREVGDSSKERKRCQSPIPYAGEQWGVETAEYVLVLMRVMCRLCDVATFAYRMVKEHQVLSALSLLLPLAVLPLEQCPGDTQHLPLLQKLPKDKSSALGQAALRCLATFAGLQGTEARSTLKSTLDDSHDTVGTLVSILKAPNTPSWGCTCAATLLWALCSGNETMKEQLIGRTHQLIPTLVAKLQDVTIQSSWTSNGSIEEQKSVLWWTHGDDDGDGDGINDRDGDKAGDGAMAGSSESTEEDRGFYQPVDERMDGDSAGKGQEICGETHGNTHGEYGETHGSTEGNAQDQDGTQEATDPVVMEGGGDGEARLSGVEERSIGEKDGAVGADNADWARDAGSCIDGGVNPGDEVDPEGGVSSTEGDEEGGSAGRAGALRIEVPTPFGELDSACSAQGQIEDHEDHAEEYHEAMLTLNNPEISPSPQAAADLRSGRQYLNSKDGCSSGAMSVMVVVRKDIVQGLQSTLMGLLGVLAVRPSSAKEFMSADMDTVLRLVAPVLLATDRKSLIQRASVLSSTPLKASSTSQSAAHSISNLQDSALGMASRLDVKERLLQLISNMCLHAQGVQLVASSGVLSVVREALRMAWKLRSADSQRLTTPAPSSVITPAACCFANYFKLAEGSEGEGMPQEDEAGDDVLSRFCGADRSEVLEMICRILCGDHHDVKKRLEQLRPFLCDDMNELRALASALGYLAAYVPKHGEGSQRDAATGTTLHERAALRLVTILHQGVWAVAANVVSHEQLEVKERFAHSYAAALWRIMAAGLVHPDLLCRPLLPVLELCLLGGCQKPRQQRATQPLSDLLAEDALGLVSELCRSKDSTRMLSAHSGVMRGVLLMHRRAKQYGSCSPICTALMHRLKTVDRYGVLKHAQV